MEVNKNDFLVLDYKEKYLCQNCNNLLSLQGSKACHDCDVAFCKRCLMLNTFCVYCHLDAEDLFPMEESLLNELAGLMTPCIHKKNGCHQVLEYSNIKDHEKKCKFNPCKEIQDNISSIFSQLDYSDKCKMMDEFLSLMDMQFKEDKRDINTAIAAYEIVSEKLEEFEKYKLEKAKKEELVEKSNRIYSASIDGCIKVWDIDNGECIRTLNHPCDCFISFKINSDAKDTSENVYLITAGPGSNLSVLDCSGEIVQTLKGHNERVTCLAKINNCSLIASGGEDKSIKLWRNNSNSNAPIKFECIQTLTGHDKAVHCLSLFKDKQKDCIYLASGSQNATIKVWLSNNLISDQNFSVHKTLTGHTDTVESVITCKLNSINEDMTLLVSASSDKTLILWNLYTGELINIIKEHTSPIKCLSYIRGNRMASCDLGGLIKIWEIKYEPSGKIQITCACIKTLKEHTNSVTCLKFFRLEDRDVLVSSGADRSIKVFDMDDMAEFLFELDGHKESVICLDC